MTTWTSVVAVRYFQKKREILIESETSQALNGKTDYGFNPNFCIERRIDIHDALSKMQNQRYRQVIEMLDIQEMRPDLLAEQMNVTVDNLYNIHRRALLQLRMLMGRKEDYYD
ncbi:MAG: sigma-70 family RNA polymerase sigma factor [Bacteroidales bacterium]|nr:sigma-70 family RNA polymerase sigma factor [Bacteroidales bacterium]